MKIPSSALRLLDRLLCWQLFWQRKMFCPGRNLRTKCRRICFQLSACHWLRPSWLSFPCCFFVFPQDTDRQAEPGVPCILCGHDIGPHLQNCAVHALRPAALQSGWHFRGIAAQRTHPRDDPEPEDGIHLRGHRPPGEADRHSHVCSAVRQLLPLRRGSLLRLGSGGQCLPALPTGPAPGCGQWDVRHLRYECPAQTGHLLIWPDSAPVMLREDARGPEEKADTLVSSLHRKRTVSIRDNHFRNPLE